MIGFLVGAEIERARLEDANVELSDRLETRIAVDRAKGILQGDLSITENEAYRMLQRESRQRRRSMREIAEAILLGDELKSVCGSTDAKNSKSSNEAIRWSIALHSANTFRFPGKVDCAFRQVFFLRPLGRESSRMASELNHVTTLANMARFIIADLTDPSWSPYELGRIVTGTKVALQDTAIYCNMPSVLSAGLFWLLRRLFSDTLPCSDGNNYEPIGRRFESFWAPYP
jgi:hypothetical protein